MHRKARISRAARDRSALVMAMASARARRRLMPLVAQTKRADKCQVPQTRRSTGLDEATLSRRAVACQIGREHPGSATDVLMMSLRKRRICVAATVAVTALSGCGTSSSVAPARKQTIDLGWHEATGLPGNRLIVDVRRLVIRGDS